MRRASVAFVAILLAVFCVAAGRVAAASAATASSVVVSASTTTPAPGAQVTLTVTASNPAGLSAGTFTLYADGNAFATGLAPTSSDSTTATLVYVWPFGATTNVTASYGSGFASTTSAPLTITVAATTPKSTVTLSATPDATAQGNSVSFSVSVAGSGATATPTGTVTLWDSLDGGSPQSVAQVRLDPTGSATYDQGGFGGGSHAFTATYNGDATYPSAGSNTVTIQITPTPSLVQTTITASASPNPVPAGGTTTLSAHIVQAGTPLPATNGSVTFRNADGGALIATAPVDASGNASITLGGWNAGSYSILAEYVGSTGSGFGPSSASIALTTTASSTVTVTAPSATTTYGTIPTGLTPTYGGFPAGVAPQTPAQCTTPATATSAPGTYGITCSGAADPSYSFTYVSGTLTIVPAQLSVNVPSATMVAGSAVPTLTPTLTGFVNGETASVISGAATCTTTATSASAPGSYPVTCTVGTLGSPDYTFAVVGTGTVTVTPSTTPTRIVDWVSGPILAGKPVLLSATLFAGTKPLGGKTVTLTLGSASCTTVTLPLVGTAFCTVTAPTTLGPTTSSATFAGDTGYGPSTDTNNALLYAFPAGGCGFVVGDRSDSGRVTFWGSEWSKSNSFSGGASSGSSSFKGFGATSSSDWTTGATSNPPSSLPSYLGVYVTSSVGKHGSTLSGSIVGLVIVKVDAGYDGSVGHAGTGTVVASL